MGGGGGRGPSRDDLARLEELAKKTLKEGDQPKRNIFLSFAYEDINEVNLLRGQAKNESSELEFNDWSLREPFNSKRAEYIKQGIRERIRQSSVTLVYLSEDSIKSKWVDWEIRESFKLGKGVIGVYKGDKPPPNLPPLLRGKGVHLVQWTHEGLSSAIERAASEGEEK